MVAFGQNGFQDSASTVKQTQPGAQSSKGRKPRYFLSSPASTRRASAWGGDPVLRSIMSRQRRTRWKFGRADFFRFRHLKQPHVFRHPGTSKFGSTGPHADARCRGFALPG